MSTIRQRYNFKKSKGRFYETPRRPTYFYGSSVQSRGSLFRGYGLAVVQP